MKNDLFYFCSMMEYVSRKTKNSLKTIISYLNDEDIKHELEVACVNHCLTFEQVSDEWIENYKIKNGNFDNISTCKYTVPSYTSIGKVYQRLILDISNNDDICKNIRKVYNSFICDEISNYNSNIYYSSPEYLKCCFISGKILD